MSAYVVSNSTIDSLISTAIELKLCAGLITADSCTNVTTENATDFGRMLLRENVRSVAHRYRLAGTEEGAANDAFVTDYKFSKAHDLNFEGTVAKCIQSLDYQSCETNDWNNTVAHEFLYRLMLKLIERVPGFDAAPWAD